MKTNFRKTLGIFIKIKRPEIRNKLVTIGEWAIFLTVCSIFIAGFIFLMKYIALWLGKIIVHINLFGQPIGGDPIGAGVSAILLFCLFLLLVVMPIYLLVRWVRDGWKYAVVLQKIKETIETS